MQTRLTQPAVYTIPEFCKAYRIARSHFYNLLKTNLAPKVMKVGTSRRISLEAADEWRKQCEAKNITN